MAEKEKVVRAFCFYIPNLLPSAGFIHLQRIDICRAFIV